MPICATSPDRNLPRGTQIKKTQQDTVSFPCVLFSCSLLVFFIVSHFPSTGSERAELFSCQPASLPPCHSTIYQSPRLMLGNSLAGQLCQRTGLASSQQLEPNQTLSTSRTMDEGNIVAKLSPAVFQHQGTGSPTHKEQACICCCSLQSSIGVMHMLLNDWFDSTTQKSCP